MFTRSYATQHASQSLLAQPVHLYKHTPKEFAVLCFNNDLQYIIWQRFNLLNSSVIADGGGGGKK